MLVVVAGGCASSTWRENDFVIGGRKISVPPADMERLRGAWSEPVPYARFSTALTPSEARWAADFIALMEGARDRANPCRQLVLRSISPSSADIADLSGRHRPASRFDEKWVLTACGVERAYRAYHPASSLALVVDEARL